MKYRPYNTTFKFYWSQPFEESEAKEFIEIRNQQKGGNWELHTEQYFEFKAQREKTQEKVHEIKRFDFFEISYVANPVDPICRIKHENTIP
jgi:hydroxymethylpyrimidine pyrophosphatase-like HAD family hydrolase